MALALIAVTVLVLLTAGYLLYGRFIARQYRVDDANVTPAARINDGTDFIPTRPFYLLGQHFSAIAAAGPIVGPVVACMAFGWLPCLVWIVVGVVLIGAVHDFSALIASVRHGAHSIADVAREHLGRRAYLALVAFIWLALLYVIVAFTDVTAGTFLGNAEELQGLSGFNTGGAVAAASVMYLGLAVLMGLAQRFLKPPMWLVTAVFVPATLGVIYLGTRIGDWTVFAAPERLLGLRLEQRANVWYGVILAYCFVASLLPMWVMQQPRGYLGGFVLYLAIGLGVLGILLGGFGINTHFGAPPAAASAELAAELSKPPPVMPVADYARFFGLGGAGATGAAGAAVAPPMTGLVFPFLFVTIACGACSGFHGLVCGGTTSRQLARESHAHPVAFGAMLMEGFVAVIALATVMILTKDQLAAYRGRPGAVYGDGLATFAARVFHIESAEGRNVARTFGQMAVATFVFDTLDVSTRLGRYLLTELFGGRVAPARGVHPHLGGEHDPAPADAARGVPAWLGAACAGLTAFIPLAILFGAQKGSYQLFWTLFGTSNQLLAALTLLGITVWLRRSGRRAWYVAGPMVFVMAITLIALGLQIFEGVRDAVRGRFHLEGAAGAAGGFNPTVLNAGVALALLALAGLFVVEAGRAMRKGSTAAGSIEPRP
jgi:carbon starvation protein